MNLLFVCSMGKLRGPTAAVVATEMGFRADSGGVRRDAVHAITEAQILWSDVIFVMESGHREVLRKKYLQQLVGKIVKVLHIEDEYDFMQPELVETIRYKLKLDYGFQSS